MLVCEKQLKLCMEAILKGVNEEPEQADCAAQIMVKCDAWGVSTHGSHMLNLIYARRKVGQLHFPTEVEILQDAGATALLDGHDGLGQVAATRGTELAIEKAKNLGIGAVLIRNTNNVGALSTYAEMIANEKMVGLVFCNASPAMAPWGGMEQFFGTQPFAIGIYTGQDTAFVADMATSQVARGKIRKAARDGGIIPDSWALDSQGNPTTDPQKAIEGLLLPMGGAKGSAIAMAIDMVAGLLSGSQYAPNVRAIHYPEGEAGVGCGIIVLDIARFMAMEEYTQKMAEYLHRMKSMKKAAGASEILLPGENKQRKAIRSSQEGVNIPDEEVRDINRALSELGIEMQLDELA